MTGGASGSSAGDVLRPRPVLFAALPPSGSYEWTPAERDDEPPDADAVSLVSRSRQGWPWEYQQHACGEGVLLAALLLSYPAPAFLLERRHFGWRYWPGAESPAGHPTISRLDDADGWQLVDSLSLPRLLLERALRMPGSGQWWHGGQLWRLTSSPELVFVFQALETTALELHAAAADSPFAGSSVQDLVLGVLPRDPSWLEVLRQADVDSLPAPGAALGIVERLPYRALLEASDGTTGRRSMTVAASALRVDRRVGERRAVTPDAAAHLPRTEEVLHTLSQDLSDRFAGPGEVGVLADTVSLLGFSVRAEWAVYQLAAGLCATWNLPQREESQAWLTQAESLGLYFATVELTEGGLSVLSWSPGCHRDGFTPVDRTAASSGFWAEVGQRLPQLEGGEPADFIVAHLLDRYRVTAVAAAPSGWALSWRRETAPVMRRPSSHCQVTVDGAGRVVSVTPAFEELVGPVALGMPLADIVPARLAGLAREVLAAARTHSVVEQAIPWDRPRYRRWLRVSVHRREAAPGEAVFEVSLHRFHDEVRGSGNPFTPLLHDSLTGLYNRHALHALLEVSEHAGEFDGVVFLDLRGFKRVNDSYGHQVGDECLRQVASWLASECGRGDVAARPTGGEFLMLCSDVQRMLERLRSWGWRSASIGELTVALGIRLGWAPVPAGVSLSEAVRHADLALSAAKSAELGAVVGYSDRLRDMQQEHVASEGLLRAALSAPDGIWCAFQPIRDVASGRFIGFESLIRGFADGQEVGADALLDSARRAGVSAQVLERGLAGTLHDGRRLLALFDQADLWVNLDRLQLAGTGRLDAILAQMEDAGLPLTRVVLEVTERTVSDVDEAALGRALAKARERGARVAIDDFGCGASNLAAVAHLPVDVVKVDRSLLPQGGGPEGWRLLTAIADLAQALGRRVLVEGIETPEQAQGCADLGLTVQQGFLHGRPRPVQALLDRGVNAPVPWSWR